MRSRRFRRPSSDGSYAGGNARDRSSAPADMGYTSMRKTIFHEKWWLDAVAPGSWREVVCIRNGQVVGSLPFEELSQSGLTSCAMPQATHTLGPILETRPGKAESSARSTQSVTASLLQQIGKHHHVEMILGTDCTDVTP